MSFVGLSKVSPRFFQAVGAGKRTFSGSHATALTDFRPKLFSVRLSFLLFTSHTVTKPALDPVTKMWATLLFQSRHSMSSGRALVFPSRNGFSVLFRSEMKS